MVKKGIFHLTGDTSGRILEGYEAKLEFQIYPAVARFCLNITTFNYCSLRSALSTFNSLQQIIKLNRISPQQDFFFVLTCVFFMHAMGRFQGLVSLFFPIHQFLIYIYLNKNPSHSIYFYKFRLTSDLFGTRVLQGKLLDPFFKNSQINEILYIKIKTRILKPGFRTHSILD